MFLVIDKHLKRVVMSDEDRQKAIDYALKYSSMGANQYIIAEVLGETRQVTSSVFSETKTVSLGPLTDEVKRVGGKSVGELRQGVRNEYQMGNPGIILASGSVDRYERIPVLPSDGVNAGQQSDYGDVEGHAENSSEPRG